MWIHTGNFSTAHQELTPSGAENVKSDNKNLETGSSRHGIVFENLIGSEASNSKDFAGTSELPKKDWQWGEKVKKKKPESYPLFGKTRTWLTTPQYRRPHRVIGEGSRWGVDMPAGGKSLFPLPPWEYNQLAGDSEPKASGRTAEESKGGQRR